MKNNYTIKRSVIYSTCKVLTYSQNVKKIFFNFFFLKWRKESGVFCCIKSYARLYKGKGFGLVGPCNSSSFVLTEIFILLFFISMRSCMSTSLCFSISHSSIYNLIFSCSNFSLSITFSFYCFLSYFVLSFFSTTFML